MSYWIGLCSVTSTEWLDGSTSTYRDWARGEPNSNALCIRYTKDGFKDWPCNMKMRFTCKKGAGTARIFALRYYFCQM